MFQSLLSVRLDRDRRDEPAGHGRWPFTFSSSYSQLCHYCFHSPSYVLLVWSLLLMCPWTERGWRDFETCGTFRTVVTDIVTLTRIRPNYCAIMMSCVSMFPFNPLLERVRWDQPWDVLARCMSAGYCWTRRLITSTCSKLCITASLFWLAHSTYADQN